MAFAVSYPTAWCGGRCGRGQSVRPLRTLRRSERAAGAAASRWRARVDDGGQRDAHGKTSRDVTAAPRSRDAPRLLERVVVLPRLGSSGEEVRAVARSLVAKREDVHLLRFGSLDGDESWDDLTRSMLSAVGGGSEHVVVAESTGATLALLAAARSPSTFRHLFLVNPVTKPSETLTRLAQRLPAALRSFVPQLDEFVARRADLIASIRVGRAELAAVQTLVTLVVTRDDPVHASYEQSEFLLEHLPNAQRHVLKSGGHHPLGGSLGHSVRTLLMTSARLAETNTPPKRLEREEFIPAEDLRRVRGQIRTLRRSVSPVFVGANRIPAEVLPGERPVLFIGNHNLLGFFDLPFLINYFLTERGALVRGLAHPLLMQMPREDGRGTNVTSFGAVEVSPRNLYKLMSEKRWALLFPGGVREAHKRRNEAYTLQWPTDPEFVRVAAKFNAYIVPFACVGPEDLFDIILDNAEAKDVPILGKQLENMRKRSSVRGDPRAWKSVSDDAVDFLTPPLVRLKLPTRFYFKFGHPVDATELEYRDREACKSAYHEVRNVVESLIGDLLERRKYDEFGNLARRLEFEARTSAPAPAPWSWSRRGTYIADEDLPHVL